MTREEHFPHGNVGFCVLSESMFPITANKNRPKDTLKNICKTFLTMPFVHTTHLGNRTYQICCSINHFQQNDQNVLLFTFYKNRKWLSQRQIWQISWPVKNIGKFYISLLGYYLCLDKLTVRSGTILDGSHQDICGRKLRKLGKSKEQDESVLHLTHAKPNLYIYKHLY